MKKWLVAAGLGMAMVTSAGAQAASDIAVVNMANVFQQVAQSSGVQNTLQNEFKNRESELQKLQNTLQTKGERLQRDGSTMKASERTRLEKEMMTEQQSFSTKVQAFEQDRSRRSNEERAKLMTRIEGAVKRVADDKGYDVVMDTNSLAYHGKNVKDITANVLKQVK